MSITEESPPRKEALQIDEVDHLSTVDFRDRYLRADRPVVIKAGAKDWIAVQQFSPDLLKQKFGDHPVRAHFLPNGASSCIDGDDRPDKPQNFRQFVDAMRSKPSDGLWYLTQYPISDLPQELVEMFGELRYNSRLMQTFTGHKPYFWMGAGGSKTGLHYDLIHNFNVQITGRKLWKLYPRNQQSLLYFGEGDYGHHSVVNVFEDDLAEYPLLQQATPFEFVMEPGDILFFPDGWAHCVYSLEENISLNFFSLWLRWHDLGIVASEAPVWAYKKVVFKWRSLFGDANA